MKIAKRLLCDILLMTLVFISPWYVTAALAIVFAVIFNNYWETAATGLIMDSFFSLPSSGIGATFGIFTLSSTALVFIIRFLKSKLRVAE